MLIIGNPENRRVNLFQSALASLGQPPATVVSYHSLLDDYDRVVDSLKYQRLIRIDSPGENHQVHCQLLAWGAEKMAAEAPARMLPAQAALAMLEDRGRIDFGRQWYLGFTQLLIRLEADLPNCRFMNPPQDIQILFDKKVCQQRLESRGVVVPPAIDRIENLEDLLSQMAERNWRRVFIKPNHGSSGSGTIALSTYNDKLQIVCPIEVEFDETYRFYNNLRIVTYDDQDQIQRIVDHVFGQNAMVQQWLPKATLKGQGFDLRIVVIGGVPCHMVARCSRYPMTNLHLGNQRGDLHWLKEKMSSEQWDKMLETAEAAAAAFPDCLYIGVDLLLRPGYRQPTVIELNAFGDLLPGILFEGQETYQREIQAMNESVE